MQMATIGTLSAFDAKSQTWEEYFEILEQFFEANGIDDGDRQRAILISVVGAPTYSLLRNLISPEKPKDKTYEQVVLILKNHFNPQPSEIVQRYKFDSRTRKLEESVTEYVAELRRLAQNCNYGATLEEMLRDRIVCSINDDRIQRRLLAETNLTFDNALKIALSVEAANKNIQDLQKPSSAGCYKVKSSPTPMHSKKDYHPNSGQCYRCKGTNHTASSCRYKSEKCHNCGKIGHIARACRNARTKDRKSHPNGDTAKAASRHKSNKVEVTDAENGFLDTFALGCLTYKLGSMDCSELQKVKPYTVELNVNGQNVNF